MSGISTALLRRLSWGIAAITVASGAVQIVFTGWELDLLDADSTGTTRHLFAIVGMFMVLFGGLVLHALRAPEVARVPMLWASLQKLGAAVAVGLGVANDVFSALALGVALFDLASAGVYALYRSRLAG